MTRVRIVYQDWLLQPPTKFIKEYCGIMFLRTISKNIYFKISFFFGVNVEIGKQLTVNLCIQYEQKRTKKSYIISYEGITYIKIEKGKLYKSKQNTMARSSYRRCSIKKVFLKISINSQENTCARVSGRSVFLWIYRNF